MSSIDEEAARLLGTKKVRDPLGMWVIYDHPTDFPDKFVARRFYIGPRVILSSDDFVTSDTLNGVRALLPDGLINIGRDEHDDAKIVETWV
jgi:hypothetical protein